MASNNIKQLDAWDPLMSDSDPTMLVAAQRREVRNILKSYTGYFDVFCELIQNALDAVDRQINEGDTNYNAEIIINIDLINSHIEVSDNGCGMDETQFKQFLRPNISYKSSGSTRGTKGVGATYLAYGFNHLEIITSRGGRTYCGVILKGRDWAEDTSESVPRPKVEFQEPSNTWIDTQEHGTSMCVSLVGDTIRPKDLTWINADNADKWLTVLRIHTPLGGLYLCGEQAKHIDITVQVKNSSGDTSTAKLDEPRYFYPQELVKQSTDLREFLEYQRKAVSKAQDLSKIPAKYQRRSGLWGEWSGEQILDSASECPIRPKLNSKEKELVKELGLSLYIYLAFSTDLWNQINDKTVGLRKGNRILKGGLQLGTRNMPQGLPLTIPMTNNIGFQNLAHVIVHFDNAEPDLGRKGFQPDQVKIAEKLSVSAVTAFRKYYRLLRKPGGAKAFEEEMKIDQWKQEQVKHEEEYPLRISGKGLFMPKEELAISSVPIVEQDVVALFNQMLTSGLIRGIQLVSSSQYKQYDGLFRVLMEKPFNRFILSDENPLGIEEEHFLEREEVKTVVKILEYKYTLDGLIEEFQTEVKAADDVDLVIAWELGNKWKLLFDVISYLDSDNVHHRFIHGTTHQFTYSTTGVHAFEAIILSDLVGCLDDPEEEQNRQRKKLENIEE